MTIPELLLSAGRDVVAQMPDLGTPLCVTVLHLPEMEGGWAILRPEASMQPWLVSDSSNSEIASLVFGQMDASLDAAASARDAFVSGGLRAVTELGGVFSALLVERRERRLRLLTSLPGCRSLHYRAEGELLAVSPIDLGIVALTRCRVKTDPASLAVLTACSWPLGGARALEGVGESRPYEVLSWQGGASSLESFNSLTHRPRIDARDSAGVARGIDEVIQELQTGVRQQLAYFESRPIDVPLTAGIDSRAVLALFLSILGPESLRTYTRGADSQDVRVARGLSRRLGIEHEARPVELTSTSAFLSNAQFLATMTNGIANADTAIGAPLSVARDVPVPLGGGGEVFRGYYYNYLRRQVRAAHGREDVVRVLASSPLARLRTTRFASDVLNAAPLARLQETVGALEAFSTDPFDVLDLFYIFERMGGWGSVAWRRALGPSFAPFANHRAMSAAFQLPAPIGDHALVATIISRFAPRSVFWTPVNGAELLCLQGPGRARYTARELLRGSAHVVRNARRRLFPAERTPRQARIAHLEGTLREPIQDLLRGTNTVAQDLFTPDRLEQLSANRRGVLSELSVLGAVFSLELWRSALEKMSARPRSRPVP